MCFILLQSSVLLLILSGVACTMEVKGEDQVVAVEVQNVSPVQMGTVRVSDVLAGLVQGNLDYCFHDVRSLNRLLENNFGHLLTNTATLITSFCLLETSKTECL